MSLDPPPIASPFTKWQMHMPDVHRPNEKKSLHPEINFLPPLDMLLSFFKRRRSSQASNKSAEEEQKKVDEKAVEKLIEKLHEKDKP